MSKYKLDSSLTTHEIIKFNVFKRGHNSVLFKSWTVANEDRLEKVDTH